MPCFCVYAACIPGQIKSWRTKKCADHVKETDALDPKVEFVIQKEKRGSI